jgi:hypothetical protein
VERLEARKGNSTRTPLGRSVLLEFRSPSSLITLAGNTGKRATVKALGPKAAEKSGLVVGDEVFVNPDARCLKVEAFYPEAVDEYLCLDYAQLVMKVVRDG